MWTGGCNLCAAVGVGLFRLLPLRRQGPHPDLHDPPVLHPGDAHVQAVGLEPVAYVGTRPISSMTQPDTDEASYSSLGFMSNRSYRSSRSAEQATR